MPRLRVRRVRLKGITRDYEVSFLGESGEPARLAIIAGQISTGKTSVLEFIEYCLGGEDFPHHPEIRSRVLAALLECELQGTVFVIERAAVQLPSRTATVHSCALDGLESPHSEREYVTSPPSASDSLSQFLLSEFGVANVALREAPTRDSSGVDRLSVRDVMRLMFVQNHQLDNRNLLLEHSPHVVRLKHEQVLDLMFWAHDNTAASLAAEVRALEQEIANRARELETIETFMSEQRVPDADEVVSRLQKLDVEASITANRLAAIEEQMDAEATFGDEQRAAYHQSGDRARRSANALRDTRTQLERLTALAAQYEQDIKKLVFAKEASRLFDPFAIQVCPWCLQSVEKDASKSDDTCIVCHQPFAESEEAVDLDRELRAVRSRHKELTGYLNELHDQQARVAQDLDEAAAAQRGAQESFDEAMRARFSPFMAQRDVLLEEAGRTSSEQRELRRLQGMHGSRTRRRQELGSVRQRLSEVQSAQVAAASANVSRGDVLAVLRDRFASILEEVHFPKLSNAALDHRYVPSVRGVRYDNIGSAGAMTLISLAWYLAVFEKSVEEGGAHPGLLMIDSPQKNLVPASGQLADEYQAPAIARAVYEHLLRWAASEASRGSQVLIVDNEPPDFASDLVVVRYTGNAAVPPYGLIDDATD